VFNRPELRSVPELQERDMPRPASGTIGREPASA
jgi:hypothetical protein